jgi:glycosyltransferase involved in cell wall biosynthesis
LQHDELERAITWADVAVAYQPLPETLGPLLRRGCPVVVDVDEPHWEQRYGFTRTTQAKVVTRRVLARKDPMLPASLRAVTRSLPVLVSNPSLLDLYPGATVIPHVREAQAHAAMPSGRTRVAFIGTHRRHKGVALLRRAAAEVGVDLVLTGTPPDQPLPNERWVGTTTLEAGFRLLCECHASAVLSAEGPFSGRQLPVKAIDALIAGRVVLGSRTEPLVWAVGDAGLLVDPDLGSVMEALRSLGDVDLRERLGMRARREALARFTAEAVAPAFGRALQRAEVPRIRFRNLRG